MKQKLPVLVALAATVGLITWALAPGEEPLSDSVPPSAGPILGAGIPVERGVANEPRTPSEDGSERPVEPAPEDGSAAIPTKPPEETLRSLAGKVVASENDAPIRGATVFVEGEQFRERVSTDEHGAFALNAPPGLLMIRVWAPGRVSITTGREGIAKIALERGSGVGGQVVLPSGGAPPAPCRAWVIGGNQLGVSRSLTVQADGRFELEGGFAGDEQVAILAFCAGYATPLRLDWRRNEPLITVTLEPRGAVEVIGAATTLSLRPAFLPADIETGSTREGPHFRDLAAGRYELEIEGRDAPVSVIVQGGSTQQLDLRALSARPRERTSPLRVTIRDREGRPLPGATVLVSVAGHEHEALADDSGLALFEVGPGPLSATAALPGRLLVADEVREEGERHDVTLVLAQETILEGQVFPNEAAQLRLTDSRGAEVRSEQTDDNGRFRLEGIPAGDYTLEVESDVKVPLSLSVSLPLTEPLHVHLGQDYGRCGHDHE